MSEFELLVMIENINLLFDLCRLHMSDGVRRHIRGLQVPPPPSLLEGNKQIVEGPRSFTRQSEVTYRIKAK